MLNSAQDVTHHTKRVAENKPKRNSVITVYNKQLSRQSIPSHHHMLNKTSGFTFQFSTYTYTIGLLIYNYGIYSGYGRYLDFKCFTLCFIHAN
ncbi:hypothetical protein GDO81_029686 [Engystomops pustulosus]|uniref:Uncharacterized protein n=1 Tax=Engystomops pustulosus TaxID=76066 RepID=A0AAV6YLZ1_ENGPU|nr:hypothetical protein GDO81_029686 [Engystomops pustulosus]